MRKIYEYMSNEEKVRALGLLRVDIKVNTKLKNKEWFSHKTGPFLYTKCTAFYCVNSSFAIVNGTR